ncbi:iron-sulfur cluster-binding domain-containing protein [Streptomyces sp. NPDC050263]|uniref:iron-sulfur cluster-binding domain-containing protein n=1 Tax=Streptomyces sp. NPDC050263 TaxID=3155037 RepID=UPI00343A7E41
MARVKRVPGGLVSGRMRDELRPGDVLEATRPSGAFRLRPDPAERRLPSAPRPGRLALHHHLDDRGGLVTAERIREPADGPADFCLCGPEPFTAVVTVVVRGQRRSVPQRSGETLRQSTRRAGFTPPFSCESGDCATCMARLTVGEARMRVDNALDAGEVAEGHVRTCQAEPTSPDVTVEYED